VHSFGFGIGYTLSVAVWPVVKNKCTAPYCTEYGHSRLIRGLFLCYFVAHRCAATLAAESATDWQRHASDDRDHNAVGVNNARGQGASAAVI
jgi:hypothetical protein